MLSGGKATILVLWVIVIIAFFALMYYFTQMSDGTASEANTATTQSANEGEEKPVN